MRALRFALLLALAFSLLVLSLISTPSALVLRLSALARSLRARCRSRRDEFARREMGRQYEALLEAKLADAKLPFLNEQRLRGSVPAQRRGLRPRASVHRPFPAPLIAWGCGWRRLGLARTPDARLLEPIGVQVGLFVMACSAWDESALILAAPVRASWAVVRAVW
mgnify:CR=1 FL=1